MKSRGKRLDNAFEQLKGYMECLPEGETPPDLWMVCDFENIHLYHHPTQQETDFKTNKLRKHIKPFAALADYEPEPIRSEKGAADLKATTKMNKLFEALQEHGYTGHELEVYLARLLFCLFADDTGIFPQYTFFYYIHESTENGSDLSGRLGQLFQDLSKPEEARVKNPFLTDKVKQTDFKYINGGLFEERLELASFDRKMRQTLLDCLDFDWAKINPAIFGSMFQGVMDIDHRREIGAHYTTEENILKLINPLFMDELKSEFKKVKKKASPKALAEFHNKLASLKFLDPACGCGNFLIIAYRELRWLEQEVVREETRLSKGNDHQLLNIETHFKVKVEQFYGIEILSWPCQIARTGMWLMDHLMNMEASEEFGKYYDRLPLTKGAEIVHANAHRVDWGSIVPKNELNYILGNPPYVGYAWRTEAQHSDMDLVFQEETRGHMDYVGAWYKKASTYIENTAICAAFVSTNSICQGEQVVRLWKPIFNMGIEIDFAYRTFKWSNEAKGKAAVHCVIVGFSHGGQKAGKTIFESDSRIHAPQINAYLIAAPPVFVEPRNKPICDVPAMSMGNMPRDGGNLLLEQEEYDSLVEQEPLAKKYIRKFSMGEEFINNIPRYCLWLANCPPDELRKMPIVLARVEKVRRLRLASKAASTKQKAKTPTIFGQLCKIAEGESYIAIPKVSSERREYIPIDFLDTATIPGDKLFVMPAANLYHFGVLISAVHNAWMRAVCGRLKSDYSYSNTIVYNNFPWPDAAGKQKAEIEKLAQGILDARAKFPKSSLADLYDPLAMPPELLKAHNALDKAVMKLYSFPKDMSEPDMVARLMEMYSEYTLQP
jgi:type I restriction-modification system DNA methylase subunit